MASQKARSDIALEVENIGGISDTRVQLGEGVTILEGRNATNRTSLLQALAFALGWSGTPLKSDADSGTVRLRIGDSTYERSMERSNGTITVSGEPYLDDATVAELFAFLFEDNEARMAVNRGGDLREVILRPVDVDEIERRIRELRRERQDLEESLSELDSVASELENIDARRTQIENEIETVEAELDEVNAAIESADLAVPEGTTDNGEADDQLEELQEKRTRLEDLRHERRTLEETIDSLETEAAELEEELASISTDDDMDLEEIERQLRRLRDEQTQLDSTIADLQHAISFNEEMLDGDRPNLDAIGEDDSDGSLTDALVEGGEELTCWTCGSAVAREAIETTLDQLRDFRTRQFDRKRELDAEINDLQDKRQRVEAHRARWEEIKGRLDEIESEQAHNQERLEALATEREDLEKEIEILEEEIKQSRDESYSEILDLQRQKNELEFERDRLRRNRDELDEHRERLEDRLTDRPELEARLEEIREELDHLRNRVERIETETIDAFNSHMEAITDLLEYRNIERVWIERKTTDDEAGGAVTESTFDLHIVRTTDDGVTYEDSITNLSESEREVIGLVFALAGYLVHDVYDEVPVLLLDSLEAIDAQRIRELVGYFEEYSQHLVSALLSEDAAALPDEYRYVTEI